MNKTRLKASERNLRMGEVFVQHRAQTDEQSVFSGHRRLTNSAELMENEVKSKASIDCIRK